MHDQLPQLTGTRKTYCTSPFPKGHCYVEIEMFSRQQAVCKNCDEKRYDYP